MSFQLLQRTIRLKNGPGCDNGQSYLDGRVLGVRRLSTDALCIVIATSFFLLNNDARQKSQENEPSVDMLENLRCASKGNGVGLTIRIPLSARPLPHVGSGYYITGSHLTDANIQCTYQCLRIFFLVWIFPTLQPIFLE